jgi:L-ribulose-5-phosphate 4-epimerase
MALPMLGTTHADFARGPIPCTRDLTGAEVASDFEANTGRSMVEVLAADDILAVPAVLVKGHGPFCWGRDARESVTHAIILEEVAKMAHRTLALNPMAQLNPAIADRHFGRKHGPSAYYGQASTKTP